MKKILASVLVALLAATMAFGMTACGDDSGSNGTESTKPQTSGTQSTKPQTSSTASTTSASGNDSVFPSALKDVPAIEVPAIDITGWELTGGMIDGVEMEESDLAATLEACGGKLQFIFPGDGNQALLINGEKSLEGTYAIVSDKFAIHAAFTGYEYFGVFTKVGEETVMILANKEAPETALYMTMIDEG